MIQRDQMGLMPVWAIRCRTWNGIRRTPGIEDVCVSAVEWVVVYHYDEAASYMCDKFLEVVST